MAFCLTWLLSRSATPAILASARLYCVILSRNSWRAASISASGFCSSMPLMNRLRNPLNSRPMRANIAVVSFENVSGKISFPDLT